MESCYLDFRRDISVQDASMDTKLSRSDTPRTDPPPNDPQWLSIQITLISIGQVHTHANHSNTHHILQPTNCNQSNNNITSVTDSTNINLHCIQWPWYWLWLWLWFRCRFNLNRHRYRYRYRINIPSSFHFISNSPRMTVSESFRCISFHKNKIKC